MDDRTIRDDIVGRALESYSELNLVLRIMTESEVLKALELEKASARRASIITKLAGKAARLYSRRLKEQ